MPSTEKAANSLPHPFAGDGRLLLLTECKDATYLIMICTLSAVYPVLHMMDACDYTQFCVHTSLATIELTLSFRHVLELSLCNCYARACWSHRQVCCCQVGIKAAIADLTVGVQQGQV